MAMKGATKQEKRRAHNRENLATFFGGKNKHGQDRRKALDSLSPETVVQFAKMYLDNQLAIEEIQAYARRFKQAVGEIDESDVRHALEVLDMKKVMES
jgi:hypothetical protein